MYRQLYNKYRQNMKIVVTPDTNVATGTTLQIEETTSISYQTGNIIYTHQIWAKSTVNV